MNGQWACPDNDQNTILCFVMKSKRGENDGEKLLLLTGLKLSLTRMHTIHMEFGIWNWKLLHSVTYNYSLKILNRWFYATNHELIISGTWGSKFIHVVFTTIEAWSMRRWNEMRWFIECALRKIQKTVIPNEIQWRGMEYCYMLYSGNYGIRCSLDQRIFSR